MKKLTFPMSVQQALEALGGTIAAARREKGMSQAELAVRMDITTVTLSRLERGNPGTGIGIVFKALWMLDLPLWPSLDLDAVEQIRLLQNKAAATARASGQKGKLTDAF